jgi:hypothetical protein
VCSTGGTDTPYEVGYLPRTESRVSILRMAYCVVPPYQFDRSIHSRSDPSSIKMHDWFFFFSFADEAIDKMTADRRRCRMNDVDPSDRLRPPIHPLLVTLPSNPAGQRGRLRTHLVTFSMSAGCWMDVALHSLIDRGDSVRNTLTISSVVQAEEINDGMRSSRHVKRTRHEPGTLR